MKFGKEYVAQMIPEWQQAYMDYTCLKTILREIKTSQKRSESQGVLKRKLSGRRNFSGLTKRYSRTFSSRDLENHDIMVHATTGDDGFEKYETTILKVSEVGRESELVFFKTLDLEFDKVNRFYRSNVEELVKEAVVLNRQMDALIAYRIKLDQPSTSWSCSETVSVDINALDSKEQRKTLAEEMGIKVEENRKIGNDWKIAAWVFSGLATFYGTYWDIVYDWGLLHRPSKSWLREKLLVPHKSVYYVAMVVNVVLRLAWLQTVLDFNISFLHRETMVALIAILEIIRRGIWNFFRLENEHLNNVGKFRAFKSVPLPFNYDEEEDRDS
ncbi:unnamed protein product [Arabidopsis thaliana]|uniref:(thale cress) hypothetical protein n=1 Tax=Arabidopsis thaliana TaxID=3702 RepID=A0A7G2DY21_ARATH|nr:unnamed protein product [Arabidopsis thaliana]